MRRAQQADQFGMDDFDEGLSGRETPADLLTNGTLSNAIEKRLDDRECNVRFKQGKAHLAQGVFDITFGNSALAGKVSRGFA
jgi:hypothetical protein